MRPLFFICVVIAFTLPPSAAPQGAALPPLTSATQQSQNLIPIQQAAPVPVSETVDVLVLNTPKQINEEITESDLTVSSMAKLKVPKDALTKAEDIVGKAPRRNMQPDQPIRAMDLREFLVIKKGDVVSIQLQTPNMVLSAQGKALDAGAKGETIRVLNTSSNKTLFATVSGPNQVTVMMSNANFK